MVTIASRVGVLLLLAFTVPGCSGSKVPDRAKVYKVSGKVTYLNAPLIGAVVSFSPKGDQPAAIGRTNDLGEFQLTTYGGNDGAAAGDYAVLVALVDSGTSAAAPEEAHGTDAAASYGAATAHSTKSAKGTASMLPAKYNDINQTPLKAKVDPNADNKFTFEVK
jgi:hypothetical protein